MPALGLAAALALLALGWPYLRQCWTGAAQPHPLSWGIWAVLGVIGTAATVAAGAGPTALVVAASAGLQLATFVVALRRSPLQVTARELWPLVPAVAGCVVWIAARQPLAAALGVVVADACGLWPTLTKTWRDPSSEPALLWLGGAIAFAVGCVAVEDADLASLIYPVFLALGNTAVAVLAWDSRPALFRGTGGQP